MKVVLGTALLPTSYFQHGIAPHQMSFKRGLNYPFADILDARQRVFDRLRPDDDTTTPG